MKKINIQTKNDNLVDFLKMMLIEITIKQLVLSNP